MTPSTQPAINAVLLTLAYVGTDFHGFAVQTNAHSVGGTLLDAIRHLDPSVRNLRVVSRTDTGVHARGQLVAFDVARAISPRGWVLGLARHLPDSIAPRSAQIMPVRFDPRGYAKRKWYRYSVLRDCRRDPILGAMSWRVGYPLNLELACDEARTLIGSHDFAAFRSAADERTTTVRTITDVSVSKPDHDARLVYVDVRGDGFLHNMVRIIVGTLVDVARGRLPPGAMARAFVSLDRRDLGVTAPAKGLCLQRVTLDCDVDGSAIWPDPGVWPSDGAKRP
jgi:tRNA pseudouridine38-40 synthase